MSENNTMMSKHGRNFFYICLAVSLIMVFLVWRPFIKTIILSMICAAVFYPLYLQLVHLFKDRRSLASLTTCLILIFLVIMPLSVITLLLAQEATNFYITISAHLQQGMTLIPTSGPLAKVWATMRQYIPTLERSTGNMESQAVELVKMFVNFVMTHSMSVISNITNMILQFFLLIFTLFYFLRDGSAWLKDFSEVIPLPESQKNLIVTKFKDVSMSTVVGILLTALFQGILGGIGFWIAGVSPVLWGTAVAFSSLIPVVGAALVWIPAGIVLIALGYIKGGIFILIWGATLVSTVDNFLRPFLMRGSTKVSPVWILFSILGGLELFGFTGILIGPLVLTMAITLIMIYQEEYSA